jgi:hypothetical protein
MKLANLGARAAAAAAAVMTHLRAGAATMRAHAQAIVPRLPVKSMCLLLHAVLCCAVLCYDANGVEQSTNINEQCMLVTSDRTMVEVMQRVSRALTVHSTFTVL